MTNLNDRLRAGDAFTDGIGRVEVVDHAFLNGGRRVRLTLRRPGAKKKWTVDL